MLQSPQYKIVSWRSLCRPNQVTFITTLFPQAKLCSLPLSGISQVERGAYISTFLRT